MEAAKLVVTMEGVKAFELYGNLLTNNTRYPWKKIFKAQVICFPWEYIYRVVHTKNATKTWISVCGCVVFYLQQVF